MIVKGICINSLRNTEMEKYISSFYYPNLAVFQDTNSNYGNYL